MRRGTQHANPDPKRRLLLKGLALAARCAATVAAPPVGVTVDGILRGPQTFVQRSLQGRLDYKYVLIVGDSYAAGLPFQFTTNLSSDPRVRIGKFDAYIAMAGGVQMVA